MTSTVDKRVALYGSDDGAGSRSMLATALKRAFALAHGLGPARPGKLVAATESLDLVAVGESSRCPVVALLELHESHVLCLALAAPTLDARARDLLQAHVARGGEGVCVAIDTAVVPDETPLRAELEALGAECLAMEAFSFLDTVKAIDSGERPQGCERLLAQLAPRTVRDAQDPCLFTYVMLGSRKWLRAPAIDDDTEPPAAPLPGIDRMLAIGTMDHGELTVGDAITLLTTAGPVSATILEIAHKDVAMPTLATGKVGSLTLDTSPEKKLPQKGVAVRDSDRAAQSKVRVTLLPLGGRGLPSKSAKLKLRWRGASSATKIAVAKNGDVTLTLKGVLYPRSGELLPLLEAEDAVALVRVLPA